MRPCRAGRDRSGYSPLPPQPPGAVPAAAGRGTRVPPAACGHSHVAADGACRRPRVQGRAEPTVSPHGAPKRWGTHTATAPALHRRARPQPLPAHPNGPSQPGTDHLTPGPAHRPRPAAGPGRGARLRSRGSLRSRRSGAGARLRSRHAAQGRHPHRGPAEGDPVPAAVLRGAQAALPRGRRAHGAAPHRGLRQGARHEGDPADGFLPAQRGPQPLSRIGAAGVQGSHQVQHYVEKPSTFVSEIINCGIYLFTPAIFQHIGEVFQRNQQELALEESSNGWQRAEVIRLEQDVFTALAGSGKLFVYKTDGFWSQIKSAGSAIYASRLYLNQYSKSHPERLAQNKPGGPVIRGNVYIHPTASIDSTAVLGPNVSIGEGVTVGAGVRVRESIVLHGASLHDHTCVLNTIVGWDSTIGRWARVEGTPSDPNPNDPYAKIDSETLFRDGRLTPSITILGCSVTIPAEVVILNSIVLPHKELSRSYKNQIIL
ncbi:mannose-1-phosphate guanyltransferase alpha isoform X2 [Onychostruthus taczanowskii]|uniref:mannose-1-phosphate guanyltransferase alpha isoform X2 n=1 Tax=Onychostruthus taczanowskii TaxID=356909 RepID=UPI001B80373C|nr:mannose-1-phosphate guanyltransferase alpha isoform X2 [Onychostruthus taczanowskii]